MDLACGFLLSFLFVVILFISREYKDNKSIDDSKIEFIIGWSIILFSLILGFTIGNFYNRYIETRNMLVDEVVNLQIIYRTFKVFPNTDNIIDSIKLYVSSILNNSEDTFNNHINMDNKIIEYFNENQSNQFLTTTMNRLSSSEKIKTIKNEILNGQFFINILWFLLALIVIPFYFLKTSNKINQSVIELFLFTILITGIVLCEYINNPFIDSPIKIKFDSYYDLLNEINLNK